MEKYSHVPALPLASPQTRNTDRQAVYFLGLKFLPGSDVSLKRKYPTSTGRVPRQEITLPVLYTVLTLRLSDTLRPNPWAGLRSPTISEQRGGGWSRGLTQARGQPIGLILCWIRGLCEVWRLEKCGTGIARSIHMLTEFHWDCLWGGHQQFLLTMTSLGAGGTG